MFFGRLQFDEISRIAVTERCFMSVTHEFVQDERNQEVLVYVNGELFARDEAKVSVFDSAFLVGDGFWESFRLHNGQLAFVDQHLARLEMCTSA
jgi:hypothetical protein